MVTTLLQIKTCPAGIFRSRQRRGCLWISAGLLLAMLSGLPLEAQDLTLGLLAGRRTLTGEVVKNTYDDGSVLIPYVRWGPRFGLGVELAYEAGYSSEGEVGLFAENSKLSIEGWEMSGIYQIPLRIFMPYVKAGVGYYHYEQTIDSTYTLLKVDHNQLTYLLGAGMHVILHRKFTLLAEFKYVPLGVEPFDVKVDLGGLRFLAGFSFSLSFRD